ncbi:Cytochrome P450 86B1 [Bienertia sinuspersici]
MEITTNLNFILISLFTQIHIYDIVLAFLGYYLFSCIYEILTNKGPMLWPIVGILPTYIYHFNEFHEWNTKALEKSEGSYRIRGFLGGFPGIMIADPIKIEHILKTKFKNFPKGEYYRERFRELLGNGIFNSDDDEWREQRRIATSEMHTTRFVQYSLTTMQSLVIEKQVNLSRENAMDLQELLLRFTFDNVCVAAFGVDPGCLALDLPEIPFAKAFEEATEYSLFRFLVPPFIWKTMRFLNLGKERKLKHAVKTVHEFAETTVKNRKADLNKAGKLVHDDPSDLLSRLIKMDHTKNPQGIISNTYFSNKFLKDFCTSFILAGRDTSSVALVWFFWLLHEHSSVEDKILLELHEILAERGTNGEQSEIVFQADELDKMVYLQAAISESLRLYPSVPIDIKQAKEDDVLPDGTLIQKGNRILYHVYAMGRIKPIWGEDCLEFKPERWLKDGQFVSENQFKYLVFNAGPRLCVGKKFAYTQMKMVAASVLLRYRIKVVDGQVIAPKVTTTLYMKFGLLVTFQPR